MDKIIPELITVSNIFELVEATVVKVGLEYMAPIEKSRLDEIVSSTITEQPGVNND